MKIGVLAFIIVLVLSIGFVLINPITTGNVALEIQETYGLNESLRGTLSIVIEEGDVVSNDSIVKIQLVKDRDIMESGEILLSEIALLNQSDNESYFIPGEYTKAIEDIINYTFIETGSYVIKISIDSIELNVEKEIVVDSVIDGNESESSEDNESIDELGNLGTQDLSFGIMADLSPGNISSCGVINQEGNYYLNRSLINENVTTAGGGACFNITASNVVLDCQGYEIRNSTIGFSSMIAMRGVNGTTVKNCDIYITNDARGIEILSTNNSHILNNTMVMDPDVAVGVWTGIYAYIGNNNYIVNNTVTITDSGIALYSTRNNTVMGNTVTFIATSALVTGGEGDRIVSNDFGNTGEYCANIDGSNYLFANNTVHDCTYGLSVLGGVGGHIFEGNNFSSVSSTLYLHEGNNYVRTNYISSSGSIELTYNLATVTFENFQEVKKSGSTFDLIIDWRENPSLAVFRYNNTNGEISWTNESFLKNLTLDGTITFPGTVNISSNSAYVNVSAFTVGRINSSANITLRFDSALTGYTGQKMLRNGVECNLTTAITCYNFTSLGASTVVFNVSSVDGTFSIDRGTDSVVPSITQNTPSVSQTSATVIFDASDNAGIANCTAYVNGNAFHNTTAIEELNNEIAITGLSASTAYTSYVNCTDLSGNVGNSSTLSFTTSAAATETTTSSGGGGGGGGSSTTANSITLTSEQFKNGYSTSMGVGDSYYLSITRNGETEGHTITVKAVGTNTAEIEIRSEVIKLVLAVGEGKKVDLNSDGIYDVLVQLKSITSGKAEISIKAVSEISSGGIVSSAETIENKTIEDTVETEKPENKEWNMVLITAGVVCTVLVVGIGIFVFLILRARRKR